MHVGLAGPLRVLHLSDLHASFLVPIAHIDHAVSLGLEHKPDLICLTGDFITFRTDYDRSAYIRALRRLSSTAPTVAVMGNHDGGSWAGRRRGFADHRVVDAILSEAGVELLHNRAIVFRDDIAIAGVGDLWSNEIDAERAFAGTSGARKTILLSHNPDSKDALARYPWNLMLSGHTHGGQVLMPGLGPRWAPVRDHRYVDGLRPWRNRWIQVSRGVGNVSAVRFRCRPEVNLLTLT